MHYAGNVAMNCRWRIEMLGGLSAHCEDHVITRFRTEKTASLIAFLAFHAGREYPREFLADLMWPDSDPESSRHNLRNALSSLRQQFISSGPCEPILLADRKSVRL